MSFDPFANLPGGYSTRDGTIDFYGRINSLVKADMTVLDLGAGRAAWFEDDRIAYRRSLRNLRGKVRRVVAVDVDPAVHANRAADETHVMAEDAIPLADASIDVIVSDYVLEHVADPASFFREINRVLKPGGWFCARTPHKYNFVSIAARLVSNANHVKVLRRVQPDRKAEDVFPTCYKLNRLIDIRSVFRNYDDRSFLFRGDQAYYLGSAALYRVLTAVMNFVPAALVANIFVFVRKPGGE